MGNLCPRKSEDALQKTSSSHDPKDLVAAPSAEQPAAPQPQVEPVPVPTAAAPPARRKLKDEEAEFARVKGELLYKVPGFLDGWPFDIYECEDCDIFILDWTQQATVRDCTNCRIFLGPCEGSVQLENLKNCVVVVAAEQLRIRDCEKMDILVYVSAGQPVIETSRKVRFGAYDASYFELRDQFSKASLDVWDSEWSNIHEFANSEYSNMWSYLPADVTAAKLLPRWSEVKEAPFVEQRAVPRTNGLRPLPEHYTESVVVAVLPGAALEANAYAVMEKCEALGRSQEEKSALQLIRTRKVRKLNSAQASAALSGAALASAQKSPFIALEWRGVAGSTLAVQAALRELPSDQVIICANAEAAAAAFFPARVV